MAFGDTPLPEGNLGRPEFELDSDGNGAEPPQRVSRNEEEVLSANRKIFALQVATDNNRLVQDVDAYFEFVNRIEAYLKNTPQTP